MKKIFLILLLLLCTFSYSKKKRVIKTNPPILKLDIMKNEAYKEYYPDCFEYTDMRSVKCLTSFKEAKKIELQYKDIKDPIYFTNLDTSVYDYYQIKKYIFIFSKKDLNDLGVENIEELSEFPYNIEIIKGNNKYKISQEKLTKLIRNGQVEFMDYSTKEKIKMNEIFEAVVFFWRAYGKNPVGMSGTADNVFFDQEGNSIFYGKNEKK